MVSHPMNTPGNLRCLKYIPWKLLTERITKDTAAWNGDFHLGSYHLLNQEAAHTSSEL